MKIFFKKLLLVLPITMLWACHGTNCADVDKAVTPEERVLSILNETRTTQYFSGDSISTEDMTTILEAGRNATSGRNKQAWYFAAIINPEIIKDMASEMPKRPPHSSHPKAQFADAPAAIVMASEPNTSFDLGLACENMVIASTSLGYGTKIVAGGVAQLNTPENRDLLQIPEGMNIEVILLVGMPDTTIDTTLDGVTGASTRKPLNEVSKIIQ